MLDRKIFKRRYLWRLIQISLLLLFLFNCVVAATYVNCANNLGLLALLLASVGNAEIVLKLYFYLSEKCGPNCSFIRNQEQYLKLSALLVKMHEQYLAVQNLLKEAPELELLIINSLNKSNAEMQELITNLQAYERYNDMTPTTK